MSIFRLDDVTPELHDTAWVADSATVVGNVIMAEGSSVWFGAVVRGDNEPIEIGERANIQDNSVLHSDPGSPLKIGAGVTVGHQAMLHGCTIGENSLVGIGATVLNGAVIGENSLVGAHSLVTEGKVFPPNSLIIGSPAKAVKTLNEGQIAHLKLSADYYVKNAQRFSKGMTKIS